MNRGPGLFELLVDLVTNKVIDGWELAHKVRVKFSPF